MPVIGAGLGGGTAARVVIVGAFGCIGGVPGVGGAMLGPPGRRRCLGMVYLNQDCASLNSRDIHVHAGIVPVDVDVEVLGLLDLEVLPGLLYSKIQEHSKIHRDLHRLERQQILSLG